MGLIQAQLEHLRQSRRATTLAELHDGRCLNTPHRFVSLSRCATPQVLLEALINARASLDIEQESPWAQLDPQDQSSLDEILAQCAQLHAETGQWTLWMVLGELACSGQGPQSLGLIWIPIRISVDDAHQYRVSWTGHPCRLPEALQQQPELSLDTLTKDIPATLNQVELWLGQQKEMALSWDHIRVGNYDLANEAIDQDLACERWNDKQPMESHPILSGLLGPGFAPSARQSAFCSPYLSGQEDLSEQDFVQDVDQYQAEATLAACAGDNMVIEGPPGTGKTQTMTNILGTLVGQGKRVLVLSHAMADLVAIERRLARTHLRHAALALYDASRPPSAVAAELAASLTLGAPGCPDRKDTISQYQKAHARLNEYASALAMPVGQSGWNFQEIVGRLLSVTERAKGLGLPEINFESIAHWDSQDFEHAQAGVQELCAMIETQGPIANSPFAPLEIGGISAQELLALRGRFAQVASRLQALHRCNEETAKALEVKAPTTLSQVHKWARALSYLDARPSMSGLCLDRELWSGKQEAIVQLLATGTVCASLVKKYQEQLLDQAWDADLVQVRAQWLHRGQSWFKRASGDFRRAQSTLRGLLRGPIPKDPAKVLHLVDAVMQYQKEKASLEQHDELGRKLFGEHWCGEHSDWDKLQCWVDWILDCQDKIEANELPAATWKVLVAVQKKEDPDHAESSLVAAIPSEFTLGQLEANAREDLEDLCETIKVDLRDRPLRELAASLERWSSDEEGLCAAHAYRSLEQRLKGLGLRTLVHRAQNWSLPLEAMSWTLELGYLSGLYELALSQSTCLRASAPSQLQTLRANFCQLDLALPCVAQERLNTQLYARRPPSDSPEIVELVAALADPQLRVQPAKLLAKAQAGVMALKPIVLATPSGVATWLGQTSIEFDTVLVDRAGQISLCDALGSLLRGKQVIAVGDSRQSPPPLADTVRRHQGKGAAPIHPHQSLLYRCIQQGARQHMLRLHYRSQHESLFAFVNQAFYGGELKIPPSPKPPGPGLGLRLDYDPLDLCNDHEQGRSDNQAQRIAGAVLAHARAHPQASLGVITLSASQRDAILALLDHKAQELRELMSPSGHESFFVRTIDDLNREERDHILLSVGFGCGAGGDLSASWGVLFDKSGHHHLNVALTRARREMVVFSGICPSSLHCDDQAPAGFLQFQRFLAYAQRLGDAKPQASPPMRPKAFVEQVREAVAQMGFVVRPPRDDHAMDADLYVYGDQDQDHALLGICCESDRHHRQHVARDRERITRGLLFRMGWNLHRVTCQDWLQDPAKEQERIRNTLASLTRPIQLGVATIDSSDASVLAANAVPTLRTLAQIPRAPAQIACPLPFPTYPYAQARVSAAPDQDVSSLDPGELLNALENMLGDQGPMHQALACTSLARALDLSQQDHALRDRLGQALAQGVASNRLVREGEFVRRPDQDSVTIRNRSAMPQDLRRLAWVPPQELDGALIWACEQHPACSQDRLFAVALMALGLEDTPWAQRYPLQKRLDSLLAQERIRREQDRFIAA